MSNNQIYKNDHREGNEHFVAPHDESTMAIDVVKVSQKPTNLWSDAWRSLRGSAIFWISASIILFIVIIALFPGFFTQVDPNHGCLLANSNGGPTSGHPMGFTRQGCDVYSRVIYGTRTSLSVGVISMTLITSLGVLFGSLAGYFGGWVDALLSRLGDIFFSIPYILAAVVIMSVLSRYASVWTISLAIGIFAWPSMARVLRAEILRVKNADFVMASEALGVSQFKILMKHVLPNSITPVIVIATLSLGTSIVAEATLSFLGVGLPTTIMSWGNDINQAQANVRSAPHVLLFPSLALSITVLSFIMLGESIRDALDPKARARK